jgi:hypothetical protein
MHSLRQIWLSVILSWAVLFPSTAAADSIRITSGFLELVGAYELAAPERGFRMVGDGYGGAGAAAFVFCDGGACGPGVSAQVRHAFGGLDLLVASATLDGAVYDDVNTLAGGTFAEIGFSSAHVLPPPGSAAVLTTPFIMEGSFVYPAGAERLFGSGVVTTRWSAASNGGSGAAVWNLESARYDFSDAAPVPEPGTLVLTGMAAGAAALARRRRRPR